MFVDLNFIVLFDSNESTTNEIRARFKGDCVFIIHFNSSFQFSFSFYFFCLLSNSKINQEFKSTTCANYAKWMQGFLFSIAIHASYSKFDLSNTIHWMQYSQWIEWMHLTRQKSMKPSLYLIHGFHHEVNEIERNYWAYRTIYSNGIFV